VAWGNNSHGQTTIPAGLANVKAIAAGRFHTAVLIYRNAAAIEQPRNVTTDKNQVNPIFGSYLFVPQNSFATLYDIRGRMLAQWNAGRYDLHQAAPVNGLLIIKVKGAIKLDLKYCKFK
jgi:hypothetical protein